MWVKYSEPIECDDMIVGRESGARWGKCGAYVKKGVKCVCGQEFGYCKQHGGFRKALDEFFDHQKWCKEKPLTSI